MTERHSGYLVTLNHDVREDDAKEIITALKMVKCVATVTPVVSDPHSWIIEDRVKRALEEKILEIFHPREK